MISKPNQLSSLLFLTALQNFIKIRATVQELTLGTQKDKNRYSRVKTQIPLRLLENRASIRTWGKKVVPRYLGILNLCITRSLVTVHSGLEQIQFVPDQTKVILELWACFSFQPNSVIWSILFLILTLCMNKLCDFFSYWMVQIFRIFMRGTVEVEYQRLPKSPNS